MALLLLLAERCKCAALFVLLPVKASDSIRTLTSTSEIQSFNEKYVLQENLVIVLPLNKIVYLVCDLLTRTSASISMFYHAEQVIHNDEPGSTKVAYVSVSIGVGLRFFP